MTACGVSSCKKCFNCTISTTCGRCNSGVEYCSADHNNILEAQTDCMALGGNWVITSSPGTTEFCDKPSNTANINNAENACIADGGVWSNK